MTDRRAKLEAAIEAAPHDREAYEVYADELQRLGDPRGELIALHLAGLDGRSLIDARGWEPGPPLRKCMWQWGFVDAVELDPAPRAVIEEALDHPSMRFVSTLWATANETGLQDCIDALASRSRPTLTELLLGARDPNLRDTNRKAWDLGALDQLWPQVPNLESLWLTGQNVQVGDIDLPKLVTLQVESIALRGHVIDAILSQPWRELRLLDLEFGVTAPANTSQLLEHPFPKLTSFEVHGSFVDDLIAPLVQSPLLARLKRLSLRGGLTDRGAAILLSHADAFAHLERLNLKWNYLTPATTTALATIARTVQLEGQQDPVERDDGLYDY